MAAEGFRKRYAGRGAVRRGLAAVALATLGFGLFFLLGVHHLAPVAYANGSSASPGQPSPPSETKLQPPALLAGAKAVRVPVLMYHYLEIHPQLRVGSSAKQLTLSALKFEQEMDYLAANGYHPVTLARINDAVAGSAPLPSKPIAITFDDGGLDNYTTAFPILQRHRFVATFFVITAVVGKPGCMSWAQLRVLSRAGMAIESHTVHHDDLRFLGDAKLQAELAESRQAIRSHMGLDARFLAYPYGDYDQRVMAAAEAAGYQAAFADKYGAVGDLLPPQGRYDWPREGIGPAETLAGFKKIADGSARTPSSPRGRVR
jgi:peptidoglycan/xylan/chitin deacetylase (PgdA/CDA1 family)